MTARQDFRAALVEIQEVSRQERKFLQAARVRRVLRNPRKFDELFEKAQDEARKSLPDGTVGADGEFLKWFLEWLEDGGWQLILDIIKALS